jgi:hypothetical protein
LTLAGFAIRSFFSNTNTGILDMRILVLILMMSFLSQGAFGAEGGGGAGLPGLNDSFAEIRQLLEQQQQLLEQQKQLLEQQKQQQEQQQQEIQELERQIKIRIQLDCLRYVALPFEQRMEYQMWKQELEQACNKYREDLINRQLIDYHLLLMKFDILKVDGTLFQMRTDFAGVDRTIKHIENAASL